MFWLACVATAQAPTLSDRLSALEALVQAQLKQQENFSQKVAALESTPAVLYDVVCECGPPSWRPV